MLKKLVDMLFAHVLSLLTDGVYAVSKEYYRYMESLCEYKIVYQMDEADEDGSFPVLDGLGNKLGRFRTHRCASQTIDIPPVHQDSKWAYPVPFIILKSDPDDKDPISWTVAHEIIHFLSIGPYTRIGKCTWKHHFGINEYTYKVWNNKFSLADENCCNGINELITDYIVWTLLRIDCGFAFPPYNGVLAFEDYVGKRSAFMDVRDLVRWYFQGESGRIKDCLLGSDFTNYGELCASLYSRQK